MSLMINHLLTSMPNPGALVLYLYCDYRLEDEQTLLHFLAVLLKQVGASHRAILDRISKLYVKHHAKKTRPFESQLKTVLYDAIESLDVVYVVLDALDECKRHVRMELVACIREMQTRGRVKLVVSSRSIPEISGLFQDCPCLPIRGASGDVHTYVLFRTRELSPAVHETVGLAQRVVERIVDAADGMLYADSLLDAVTVQDVESTLINFATKADVESGMAYDMAYRAALARVFRNKGRKLQLARAAFAWVTFAKCPLTKKELQHALGVDGTSTTLKLPNVDYVLGFCAGLLISSGSRRGDDQFTRVTLVHGTLKEYLVRKQAWYPRVLYNVALTSLRYLSLGFESPKSPDERRLNKLQLSLMNHMGPPDQYTGSQARQWQLLDAGLGEYALQWWLRHVQDAIRAQLAESEAQCLQQMARLMFTTGGPFSISKDWYLFWETPFHVIVRGNLLLFWDDALASGADPGETDSAGRPPLSYAAEFGRAAMVDRLLQLPSVEPSCQDADTGFTALHHAVFQRRVGLVRTLAPIVDVDATDREGKTALAHIFENRYWKVGRELFPHVKSSAVLKLAVLGGHESIVNFLDHQDYRSRLVRAKDVDWRLLFQSALRSGSKGIISRLMSILQSAPDLCSESLKMVYAEFRAQLTIDTAIQRQAGFQRLLPGPSAGTRRLEWIPDGAPKMELLSASHPNLARDLEKEPSQYRMLLHMKYSDLKRSLRNNLLPADIRDLRLSALKSLEVDEPWLCGLSTPGVDNGPWPRDWGM
ncbi:hypothetical protein PRZ48_010455 [Zasmidium cellare]|uniref:Uncharacterized protein n=1 Tax=Zasmidium cellare TaxID=395010 RepID=A0ABR0E9A5_ZASCE|nr:hypothetical protein PRZ48_010455 [Zasmidium cellare]